VLLFDFLILPEGMVPYHKAALIGYFPKEQTNYERCLSFSFTQKLTISQSSSQGMG